MKKSLSIISALLSVAAAVLFCTSCCEVKLSDNIRKLSLRPELSAEGNTLKLSSDDGKLTVTVRKNSGTINFDGVALITPEAVTFSEKTGWDLPSWITEDVLMPLRNPAAVKVRRIMLDPGHGGRDRGAAGVSGTKEKELNLALAAELKKELQARGFEVVMTRESDVEVPLGKRGVLANALGVDLFISLHHNSAANPDAAGFEVFLIDPRNCAAEKREQLKKSVRLAWLMQKKQFDATGSSGRGVKFARFRVLRDAACPALLVEAGFLSNRSEEFRCSDALFRRALAKSMADAVSGYASL